MSYTDSFILSDSTSKGVKSGMISCVYLVTAGNLFTEVIPRVGYLVVIVTCR